MNGSLHPWRTVAATLVLTLGLAGAIAAPAYAINDVAILLPTVSAIGTPPGSGSTEFKVITTPAGSPVPGFSSVMGLGSSADLIPPAGWAAALTAGYKVYVMGDPACTGSPGAGGPLAAAEVPANATALATAVTGNVVIIGTDPNVHPGADGISGAQLLRSAIGFAKDGADAGYGPGAVIALSCYYDYGAPATVPTLVPALNGFGTFMTQKAMCANTAVITASSATSPALAGLTSATLSNWSCSAHEGFTSWPSNFMPLAIVTDPTVPASFEGRGFPYIIARGKDLTPVGGGGILKVCKVAGTGIAVGTSFTFTAGSSTVTVPAGPEPGGTCVVGPSYPTGSTVTVTETIPTGDIVSSITVAPPDQLVGLPNLATGSVNVTIGSGVTEVTFTDKRTGFVEICKKGDLTGTFKFTVDPGGLGPFAVPAGACSPAIEVAAGAVVIHELPSPGTVMAGCNTIPAGQQGPCILGAQTSTVTVVPGDVSTQTIAFVTNRRRLAGGTGAATAVGTAIAAAPLHAMSGMATDRHAASGTAATTMSCAPNAAPLGRPVTCTVKVAAVPPTTGAPTGDVSFREGDATLAKVQLSADGTAAFTTTTLGAGIHAIVATYSGDTNFDQNVSPQLTVTIGQP